MKPSKRFTWGLLPVLGCVAWLMAISLAPGGRYDRLPQHERAGVPSPATQASAVVGSEDDGPGLRLRLSQATDSPQDPAGPPPMPSTTPLSEERTKAILARLPGLDDPESSPSPSTHPGNPGPSPGSREAPTGTHPSSGERDPLPAGAPTPPRSDEKVKATWPPAHAALAPPATSTGPLEVVRQAPVGAIPAAPALSITFNQPMVATASHEELGSRDLPVKLRPEPPGHWRWLGTKTLLFEPAHGFPKATEYSVEVPAGLLSSSGARLASAVTWRFRTPRPRVAATHPPSEPQARDPLMFVAFDQEIDPKAVLKTIHVWARAQEVAARLATDDEVRADPTVSKMAEASEPGHWLAFRALSPFPGKTPVTVQVGPGTPSAEGPLATTKPHKFGFKTYGPLKVEYQNSRHEARATDPLEDLIIGFNNALDQRAFEPRHIRVTPPIPGLKVTFHDGWLIHVGGHLKGHTRYKVTLDAALADIYGQALGREQTLTFFTGAAGSDLMEAGGPLVVLDPALPPSYSVYSANEKHLRISLYKVTPDDWETFARWRESRAPGAGPPPPGTLVSTTTVTPTGSPGDLVETRIDLAPALEHGLGHAVVLVEPIREAGKKDLPRIATWCQSTRMGLDAFVDSTTATAWVTHLSDGSPLGDVRLSLQPGTATATTGLDGVARLPLPGASVVRSTPGEARKTGSVLVARLGKDVAMFPMTGYATDGGEAPVHRKPREDSLAWYTFDDRRMYRPGETVHVKGWVRCLRSGPRGDLENPAPWVKGVEFEVQDSRCNAIARGHTSLTRLAGFDFSFKLPMTACLGAATIHFAPRGSAGVVQSSGSFRRFQVQQFRRPEFEVKATNEQSGPFFVGDNASVRVRASYFAGGGLPRAPVQWSVSTSPASFAPPGRSDFTFGSHRPSWDSPRLGPYQEMRAHLEEGGREFQAEMEDLGDLLPPPREPDQQDRQVFRAHTDSGGKHALRLDFLSVERPSPATVTARATVTDVNRQAWTTQTSLLVHPARHYVGLRLAQAFAEPGQPVTLDLLVTDLDGRPVPNRPISLRAVRDEWKYQEGGTEKTEVLLEETSLKSGADVVQHTLRPREGGAYRVVATVRDEQGRPNLSEISFYVAGGRSVADRTARRHELLLIPDQAEYRPGDEARILVQSPFSPAEGILTVRRGDVVSTMRFTMTSPSCTVKVPVHESHLGGVQVVVDLVGAEPRTRMDGKPDPGLGRQPASATGALSLAVPPASRKLKVEITPHHPEVEPGAQTEVEVSVTEPSGQPVRDGEVTVVVVDEAILALTRYRLGDPLATFYRRKFHQVEDHHLRDMLLLSHDLKEKIQARMGSFASMRMMNTSNADGSLSRPYFASQDSRSGRTPTHGAPEGGSANDAGDSAPPLRIRSDFNPLALFAGAVPVDASGRARVKVKVPDNLTRYRIMAVAVSGSKRFGTGESAITARMPLMARPSAPRFLHFGDRFEFPVVLQNQTRQAMNVDVAVRCSHASLAEDRATSAGKRVRVPANDRVEVRFPMRAEQIGTACFQVGCVSEGGADAAEVTVPVKSPATAEAFATYGQLDEGATMQPIRVPADLWPQCGGLEVTTSSTAMQSLTDAMLYLQGCPFESSEQLASRVMAVASLKDGLTAFQARGMPSRAAMVAGVERDIERLCQRQGEGGAFGYWQADQGGSWPHLTVHVIHALQRAREKGFVVPRATMDWGRAYLRKVERDIPRWYPRSCRHAVVAYALYVRHRMGEVVAPRARKILAGSRLEEFSLESLGWLLSVMTSDPQSKAEVGRIRRHLVNRVTETAGEAHFATSYGEGEYLVMASERRADAVLLEALINDQPASDLIPKLVAGLLSHRTQGRWENSQETAFVLLALERYFRTCEKAVPDFVARAWLGRDLVGQRRFRGRTTARLHVDIPMADLAGGAGDAAPQGASGEATTSNGGGQIPLTLGKSGKGRMYYRIGLQYAPRTLDVGPADHGFTVDRSYEPLEDAADVRRDPDGTWHIKAGATVRVHVRFVTPTRRYHVALVDPLPAGLEIVNTGLAVSATIPSSLQSKSVTGRATDADRDSYWRWAWLGSWYEHQELRDDRAEAFASVVWEGVHLYSYAARASTLGVFVAPPSRAEEMVHPETFGRSSTDRVVVE